MRDEDTGPTAGELPETVVKKARISLMWVVPLVEVLRFDADASGGARLVARWWLRGGEGRTPSQGRRSVISVAAANPDYGSTADSMSRAVEKLAGEIAGAIKDR